MNLANKITLSRIVLGPFVFVSILYEKTFLALGLFLLNIISDGLDGFIARKRREKTKFGEVIDPMVDILFSAFVSFALYLTGIKEIVWVFIPFALILLGFIFSYFSKKNKIEITHSKTKYLHTPLIYAAAIFIIFKVSFWKIFFAATITIFSLSYIEVLIRSINKFLKEKNKR